MTVTAEAAPGNSINSPKVSPNARAIRRVTARVGLACSRSIWLSMDLLTPLALASDSNDQPRPERRCLTRAPRCRLTASALDTRRALSGLGTEGLFINGRRSER